MDPERLRSEDLLTFSGLTELAIRFPYKELAIGSSKPDSTVLWYRYNPAATHRPGTCRVPFPAGVQGFLYFRQSPHSHPAAGELRFRVVRPEDTGLPPRESFPRGSDLMLDHRYNLWNIHLTGLFQYYPVIWRKLIDDGIISPSRAAELEGLALKSVARRSKILDSITDPFLYDLGSTEPSLVILHHEGVFHGPLRFYIARHHRAYPSTWRLSGQ